MWKLLTEVEAPAVGALQQVRHAAEHPHAGLVHQRSVVVATGAVRRPALADQVPGPAGQVEGPQLACAAPQVLVPTVDII